MGAVDGIGAVTDVTLPATGPAPALPLIGTLLLGIGVAVRRRRRL